MKNLLKTLAIGLAVVFTIGCGKDNVEPEVKDEFYFRYTLINGDYTETILKDFYLNKGYEGEFYRELVTSIGWKEFEEQVRFPNRFYSLEFKHLKNTDRVRFSPRSSIRSTYFQRFKYEDGSVRQNFKLEDFEIVSETESYIHYRLVADDLVK